MVNIKRRTVLGGGLATTLGMLMPHAVAKPAPRLSNFTAVAHADGKGKMPALASEYEYQVMLPWGDPLQPGGPAFTYPPNADHQPQQIGIGHDGMAFFSMGERRGLLAINHEYGRNAHVLGFNTPRNHADVLTSQAAHGLSVVEIAEQDGIWSNQESDYARRIHVNSQVEFSGPVANHRLLKNPANNPYVGTISNCANGRTPWGTYLTCEENFNLYFGSAGPFTATPNQNRYGFTSNGGGYGWHLFDPRFDLSDKGYINEGNRFGWVMEIDPMNPKAKPVKRTALGRFKHEGATAVEADDGRLLVYMGDDSRFEFIYRYVSVHPWRKMVQEGISPLDEGQMYVGMFNDNGLGEWLLMDISNKILSNEFIDQAEVLVNARVAATLLGATPMDRPEWITKGLAGYMYCSLTNNDDREQPNAANQQAPNPHGHIIRFRDHLAGQHFLWETFLKSDDHYLGEDSLSSPDGLWADPDGRLFIATDGDQREGLNNQLLVADTTTGELRRLLTGVPDCEITGFTTTPDRRTMFVNIQHPGKGNPSRTNFPNPVDGTTVPRDCTLAIRRKDGGVVGS